MNSRSGSAGSGQADGSRYSRLLAAFRLGIGELAECDEPSPGQGRDILALTQESLDRACAVFRLPRFQDARAVFMVGSRGVWAMRLGEACATILDRALPAVDSADIDAALLAVELDPRLLNLGTQSLSDLLETLGGWDASLSFLVGQTVAAVAGQAIGSYDLPIWQPSPVLVASNIDGFADVWQLPRQDVRVWASTWQVAAHLVYSQSAVRTRLQDLATATFSIKETPGSEDPRLLAPDDLPRDEMDGQINVDALFRWLREDRPAEVALDLEAIAALAHACGWFLLGQTEVASRVDWRRLFEIVARRQSETSVAERGAASLFGMPFGPIARPDSLALIEAVASVLGPGAVGDIWAHQESLPTTSTLAEPARWLRALAARDGLGDELVGEWERRVAAIGPQDPKGGRPEVPGGVPIHGHRHVHVLPSSGLTLDEMREIANRGLITNRDPRIIAAFQGEAAGLMLEGRVSLLATDHAGGKEYFGGLLAGHLLASLARDRRRVDPKLSEVIRIYTMSLGRPDVQRGVSAGGEDAAIQIHGFLLSRIEQRWPDRAEHVSRTDDQSICAWLFEQLDIVPTPRLLARVAMARSKRRLRET